MKISGVHVTTLISVVVLGLVMYGAVKYNQATVNAVEREGEEGTLPPVQADRSHMPRLVITPAKELDLGVIARDKPAEGIITVKNEGNALLEISRLATSCGCTTAHIDDAQKKLQPGQEGEIKVSVNPARISGFQSRKLITIYSNDPDNGQMKIDVVAKIDPEFTLEPESFAFGDVRKGTPAEKQIIFRQASDEAINLIEVKGANKDVEYSFTKRPQEQWVNPNRPEFLISARLSTEIAVGALDTRCDIVTDCKRMPNYSCGVKADVKSFYALKPAKNFVLRYVPQSKEPVLPTVLTIEGERPFEITNIEPSTDYLQAESKPGDKPNTVVIETSFKTVPPDGTRIDTLKVTLKSEDETVVEKIPVRVFCSSGSKPVPHGTMTPIPSSATLKTQGPVVPSTGSASQVAPSPSNPPAPLAPAPAPTVAPSSATSAIAPSNPANTNAAPTPVGQ